MPRRRFSPWPVALAVVALTFALLRCARERPDGWSEATHGQRAAAYDVVFPASRVLDLEIEIAPSDYTAMRDDLAAILAASRGGLMMPMGDGGMMPPGPGDGGAFDPAALTAACQGRAAGDPCTATAFGMTFASTCAQVMGGLVCVPVGGPGGMPGGDGGAMMPGGAAGAVSLLARDPAYVPVNVRFNGRVWSHVGMRFKGNSSLASAGGAGNRKLPFRLDFDEFEDRFPEIEDQRFYGFKKLTFSSNFGDDAQVREAFVTDTFARAGLVTARWTFVRVTVLRGATREYWGLYTMVEDPSDNAMLDRAYRSHAGNLYKPEGTGADWTVFDRAGFEKKTNEDAADWSDVERAIAALHAATADRAAWRAALEARFDVDTFLRWLAANTAVGNWDAYGGLAHNYYLYGDPARAGRLTWIPWDHNLAMNARSGGGFPGATAATTPAQVYLHTSVTAAWPLIRTLLDDAVYMARYRQIMQEFLDGPFAEATAVARLRELHALVAPHVTGARGEEAGSTSVSSAQAFTDAIDGASGLAAYVRARQAAARAALTAP